MAATNYNVNYDDKRFTQVESDKTEALSELEQTYAGMIGESDKYYQAQIDASKEWADKQSQIQQENTDFTLEQIQQQKDQAQKDYIKEQSGAYVDWQKQSNAYGVAAEQQAAAGLTGTGFSESSQVGMYNTYQNRVMVARDAYNRAVLNYDNSMKEAQLQNNAALAEIAYQALQQQLELSLSGFQYKNNLIQEQANKKVELDNMYYQRYQDVLQQINTENAMAEEIRQYNQNYQFQVQQFNEEVRQYNQDYKEKVRQFNEEIARLKKKDEQEYALEIQNLELKKKQLEQEQKQWEQEMNLKKQQLEEEKRQFNEQMSYNKSKSSGSGGGGGSSGKTVTSVTSSKAFSPGSVLQNATESAKANNESKNPTSNMASLVAIGLAGASESRIKSLLASGDIKRELKNGQYYYYKTTGSNTKDTAYQDRLNRLKNMGLSY